MHFIPVNIEEWMVSRVGFGNTTTLKSPINQGVLSFDDVQEEQKKQTASTRIVQSETIPISAEDEADTRIIPLTKGHVALVSRQDFDFLSQWPWHVVVCQSGIFYASRGRWREFMHRILMDPADGFCVDHINGNTLDNRRCNLRVCTVEQNMWNRRSHRMSGSGYIGVYKQSDISAKPYRAIIRINKRAKHIGMFETAEAAAAAYDRVAFQERGEFAILNFPYDFMRPNQRFRSPQTTKAPSAKAPRA